MGKAGSMPAGGMTVAVSRGGLRIEITKEVLPMAGQQISQAIWTDEAVVESMHRLQAALTQWDEVGAAEEPDLDAIQETDERFLEALSQLNHELCQFHDQNAKRSKGMASSQNPLAAWLQKNVGNVQQTGASSFTVRVHKQVSAEEMAEYLGDTKTTAATLRRLLAREGLVLKRSRLIDVPTQGQWYIADGCCNCVVQYDVDIDAEIAKRREG